MASKTLAASQQNQGREHEEACYAETGKEWKEEWDILT